MVGKSACSQKEKLARASGWRGPGCSTCASWTTLCYHFGPDGLSVAKKTIENFVAYAIRLYEQELGETEASVWLLLTPCKAY